MSDIADAVNRASVYLTEHPDDARYRDSHARARLVSGLTIDVDGPGGERLRTDMPKGIGGSAAAPSPGWYFRAAAASCVASLVAIRAATLQITLQGLEVLVDSESDDRGILGLDSSIDAGALSMRVEVAVRASAADPAAIEALVHWAVDHCPVTDSVRRPVPLEVRIR